MYPMLAEMKMTFTAGVLPVSHPKATLCRVQLTFSRFRRTLPAWSLT